MASLDHPAGRPPLFFGGLVVLGSWLAYFLYVRTALYWVGFLANFRVAKSVDSGLAGGIASALAVDLVLVLAFVLPHSLLARPSFKTWLGRWLPEALERSLYVLVASASLALLIWQWQPIPTRVWDLEAAWPVRLVWGLCAGGWILSVVASKSLGHAGLFGVGVAWRWARGLPVRAPELRTTGLYGLLRHPMYLGFAVGTWATPEMSVGHLLLAVAMTVYLFVGAWYEERDLERLFGDDYRRYRRQVPALGVIAR